MGNAYILVIDGLGVGAQPDATDYDDANTNTLAHVCKATNCNLPNLGKLGIGNIIELESVPFVKNPLAAFGKMQEQSAGKDSTTGHWEIAGIQLNHPFPVYEEGFPDEIISDFCVNIGVEKVLCNMPYSGSEVIKEYGEKHLQTGYPIVYTSADSVFQIACHVDVIPLETLYKWCEITRNQIMRGRHGVGRIIARPFEGKPGSFSRIEDKRHDYSLKPPKHNVLTLLQQAGMKIYSIGKIVDLFSEDYFTQFRRTKSNAEGISQFLSSMSAVKDSLVFVNLIDTDQKYGHRQDPHGFADALQEIDRAIPAIVSKVKQDDLLIITGDHGNDPTDESTDHTREYVPLIVFPGNIFTKKDLGVRNTFADVAATVAQYFGFDESFGGKSFLEGPIN